MYKRIWGCAAVMAILFLSAGVATADSVSFSVLDFTGDNAKVDLTLEEDGDDLNVTAAVDTSVNAGDLRGVFFNIDDDTLLNDLSVTGTDVTDHNFGGNVSNLGGGANINPGGPFDAGVEIGTSGASRDFFQSTTFTLSLDSGAALPLSQFLGQEFGARVTSIDSGNEGSSKLNGFVPPPTAVPAPAAAWAGLLGLGLLAASLRGGPARNRRSGPALG